VYYKLTIVILFGYKFLNDTTFHSSKFYEEFNTFTYCRISVQFDLTVPHEYSVISRRPWIKFTTNPSGSE